MNMIMKVALLCLLAFPQTAFSADKGLTVKGVRSFSYAAFTRVVFEIEAAAPYVLLRSTDGHRITVAAYDGPLLLKSPLPKVRDSVVTGLESREEAGRTVVVIGLEGAAGEVKDFVLRGPDRIVIDITRGAAPVPAPPGDKPVVIVLDPGHGGKDTGSISAQGQEKDFTLDLALRIRKILQKNPHLKVVLTREKDQALLLDERAALSNAAGAALLVSLHGAAGADARVFILDLVDEPGAQTAKPASGDFLGFESGSEQQELLWGNQQAAHVRESGTLGQQLARRLAGRENAEPVQAPLALLKAVDAPAVLIEAGAEMDRSRAAETIAGGIELYVRGNR